VYTRNLWGSNEVLWRTLGFSSTIHRFYHRYHGSKGFLQELRFYDGTHVLSKERLQCISVAELVNFLLIINVTYNKPLLLTSCEYNLFYHSYVFR